MGRSDPSLPAGVVDSPVRAFFLSHHGAYADYRNDDKCKNGHANSAFEHGTPPELEA